VTGAAGRRNKEKTKGPHGSGHISTAQHSTVQQALFYISLARSRERERASKETQRRGRRGRGRRESVVASSNRAKA
jgi:hypothetical protein